MTSSQYDETVWPNPHHGTPRPPGCQHSRCEKSLAGQITLGVANAVYARPLLLAVAHNAVAGVLLLSVVTSLHRFSGAKH